MRKHSLYVLSTIAAALLAFGCAGVGKSSVTITLAPSDGATGVALDAMVTAIFSGAITEPSDWAGVFTLRKDNAGDTLCTQVTYDSETLTVTCTHDNFEMEGSYTAVVSSAKDADGKDISTAAATFTTAAVEPNISSLTVTLAPTDGATGVALNAAVTTTFSGAITEPSDWAAVFTLKKDNLGDTLCTQVTYDSNTLTATCTHDNFEVGGSYTAVVSSAKDAEEKDINTTAATFTASASEASVSSFTRTSVTSIADGNDVEITFDFGASAVPDGLDPTVDVTGDIASVSNCAFNAGRTAYTCTVSGVDGCKTLTDYSVTLSGNGFADFSTTFNSADDEFEWPNELIGNMIGAAGDDKCWIREFDAETTAETTNGVLQMTLSAAGGGVGFVTKPLSGALAYSVYIAANDRPTIGNDAFASVILLNTADNASQAFLSGKLLGDDSWWIMSNFDVPGMESAIPAGGLVDTATHTAPFYVCLVKYNGRIKYYIATQEGAPYTELTDSNLECGGVVPCGNVADILNRDVSDWNEMRVFLLLMDDVAEPYTVQFGYTRFKATGLTGTSADCPRIP